MRYELATEQNVYWGHRAKETMDFTTRGLHFTIMSRPLLVIRRIVNRHFCPSALKGWWGIVTGSIDMHWCSTKLSHCQLTWIERCLNYSKSCTEIFAEAQQHISCKRMFLNIKYEVKLQREEEGRVSIWFTRKSSQFFSKWRASKEQWSISGMAQRPKGWCIFIDQFKNSCWISC